VIYRAIVSDSRDPRNLGRIKVMIPVITGSGRTGWIWPVISAGYLVKPSAGDQVWVVFENDDRDTPVWLGTTKEIPGYGLQERIHALETRVSALESAL